jgi:oligosaccharide translocation protein RFT1
MNNTKLVIGFQMFTRILTFLMNNLIARSTSAAHLGLVTVKLDFLATTIASLSREGVKTALLRSSSNTKNCNSRSAWISTVLAATIGTLAASAVLGFTREPEILAAFPAFRSAVLVYVLAAVLESFVDGPQALLIGQQRFREKVFIEGVALVCKVVFILLSLPGGLVGLLETFSRAQLLHSAILTALYKWRAKRGSRNAILWPSGEFASLAWDLTKQNCFKYFLAQGDLLVIGVFASMHDQGVYAIITNYGSLVLRFFMQPIEEASLQFFSRELASKTHSSSVKASAYFSLMLKTMFYVALFMTAFASFFTRPLIHILLGSKWAHETNASAVLSVYCFLVAAAGISGFMESFLNAVIDSQGLNTQKWISLASSIIYCPLAIGLICKFGSLGLCIASACNFCLRAASNAVLVDKFAKKLKMNSIWSNSLIKFHIIFAFIASFILNLLQILLDFPLKTRLASAIVAFSCILTLIHHAERDNFLVNLKNYWLK